MQNPEWYYHDDKEGIYKLTDKAPKEARKSYKEFYYELNEAHLVIPSSKDPLKNSKIISPITYRQGL